MKTFTTLVFCLLAVGWLRAQGTFTEVITLPCGDTAVVGGLGYPTWNDPEIIRPPKWGFGRLYGDFVPPNLLLYQAPPCFQGRDTLVIRCAHATQITCDTGIYVFDIVCDTPITQVFTYQVSCDSSVYAGNMSGWGSPFIESGPAHGSAQIVLEPADGAGVLYKPEANFEGLDWAKVIHFGQPRLYIFQVSCFATGTQNQDIAPITCYPNPTDGDVLLQGLPHPEMVELYGFDGARLNALWAETAGGAMLSLQGLPPGAYTVRAYAGGRWRTGRLVKI